MALTEGSTRRMRRAEQPAIANVEPFRITSLKESILLREAFYEMSNLKPNQFVQNSWGFPFIPIPEPISYPGMDRPRLAPKNVSPQFFGHPIYWIDTELTLITEDERQDTVRWSIRMFYLMLALGLIDPHSLRFVDAVIAKKGRHVPEEIEHYIKGDPCDLDSILYTEEDLLVPYEDVQKQTELAVKRILEIQTEERRRTHILQVGALRDADRLLKNDTHWSDIMQKALAISWQTRANALEGKSISEMVEPYNENMHSAAQHLSSMDRAAMTLTIHTTHVNAVTTSMYAKMLATLEKLEAIRMEPEYPERLGQIVESVFSGDGGYDEDSEDGTVYTDALRMLYDDARARLELAFMNWQRGQRNEILYESLMDAELEESIKEITEGLNKEIESKES